MDSTTERLLNHIVWKMIILASQSPRRRELLTQMGVEFEIMVSKKDEIVTETEPEKIVTELSMAKGEEILCQLKDSKRISNELLPIKEGESFGDECEEGILVISADTLVFLGEKRLGKPKDEEDAFNMLKSLSGNVHKVLTGVTLNYVVGNRCKTVSFASSTEVTMALMDDREINEYVASGEPMDKAGAYAIQGKCAKYVTGICGEYANVVGLPIARLYSEIKKIGYRLG